MFLQNNLIYPIVIPFISLFKGKEKNKQMLTKKKLTHNLIVQKRTFK